MCPLAKLPGWPTTSDEELDAEQSEAVRAELSRAPRAPPELVAALRRVHAGSAPAASDDHARVTEIRALVLHSRPSSTSEIVRRMAAARRTVDEDDVELALLDAPGVVRHADGRWQRA